MTGVVLNAQEREWLEAEAERTGHGLSSVLRGLVRERMERERSGYVVIPLADFHRSGHRQEAQKLEGPSDGKRRTRRQVVLAKVTPARGRAGKVHRKVLTGIRQSVKHLGRAA